MEVEGEASVKLPDFRDFSKILIFEEKFVDKFLAFLEVFLLVFLGIFFEIVGLFWSFGGRFSVF